VSPLPKSTKKQKGGVSFDPQVFLATVGAARTITQCPKDYKIFSQGDPAESVFYIQQGRVKLKVKSKQGKEAVIAILGPSDFLGEACLIGQTVCLATATAIAPSCVLRIEKNEILRVLHEERTFSDLFVPYLLSRNVRAQEDLVDQLFNSSEKRLARTLLLLANYGKEGTPETIVPGINQETLAGMVGTTRSRVSFFMNRFKKLGLIDYKDGLRVHRSLLNIVLHD
jgi:CRP/FNR family transcriptional regulator, cyclic AMP receptor protein